MYIKTVTYRETLSLRNTILRPGFNLEECEYPGDQDITTSHFTVIKDHEQLGIVSLYQMNHGSEPEGLGFQVRAMATKNIARGLGVGRALLEAAEQHAFQKGADYIWANGRITALGFYEKNGYCVVGDEFTIPRVGAHKLVWKSLT